MESWINARDGASENPTNVRFSLGGEKQKNPTRSSFFPTKNQGLEWMSSNPRMQIAVLNSNSDPITLDKSKKPYTILDGRHRIFLARQKGYKKVNVRFG